MIEDGVHRGSLVDLVYPDGRRVIGRFDDRQASGPAVVALRRSSLADNGYRRVQPGCRVELCRVRLASAARRVEQSGSSSGS